MTPRITASELRRIKSLFKSGHSVGEIARRLERPKGTISYQLAKEGLRETAERPPSQPKRDAAMVRSYERGVSPAKLSEKYGIDRAWLVTVLRRAGAKMRSAGGVVRMVPPKTREQILLLWAAGEPVFGIQEKTGIHVGRVKRVLTESGIEIVNRPMSGARHGSWKGGRYLDDGYVYVQLDDESFFASMRDKRGYLLEHRLVMAEQLGRPLTTEETVHHINGNTEDNRPSNLQLRRGRHGKHQCLQCGDCGSTNIVAIPIAQEDTSGPSSKRNPAGGARRTS